MMTKENVVPLIMQSHSPLPTELRLVVEEGGHHSSHSVPQSSCEVVEDHFGPMICDFTPILTNIFRNFDIAQFEMGGRAIGQMANYEAVGRPIILIDHHDIRVLISNSIFDNLLDGASFPPQWCGVWDYSRQFFDKGNGFLQGEIHF